jgi:BMFP domain-containing protein YqiC
MAERNQSIGDKFLSVLNEAAAKEDVAKLFNKLVEFVKKAKEQIDEAATTHAAELDSKVAELTDSLTTRLTTSETTLTTRQDTDRNTMYSESRTLMRLLDQKIADLESRIPESYDDAHVRSEVAAVRASIPVLPPAFDASDLIAGQSTLQETLESLIKRIEELERRPVGRGGGTSAAGVAQAFKYILKTEAVQGTIDGVNTTYTLTQPIFAILSLSINGAVIAQLPNYTINGKTITFASPLPADYAGTDFEAKYV